MSADGTDVAIVGGGIVGSACAFWAARAGLSVVGFERGQVADGSTGAGTGHIVVLDHHPDLLGLTAYSRRLWHRVAPSLPREVAWRVPGTIWLAATSDDVDALYLRRERLARARVRCIRLDRTELLRLEPALSPSLAAGLWVPDDGQLDAAAAARALWAVAIAGGARLEVTRSVRSIDDGVVTLDDGRRLTARHTINAAGCDAGAISPELEVVPRKGHVLRLAPGAPGIAHVLVESGYTAATQSTEDVAIAFNAQPQPDGTVMLGSSRESAPRGSGVDPRVVERLRARGAAFVPSIAARTAVSARVGFRPAIAGGHLPWIGPVPGQPTVWAAAGHEGLGVTTALGTGRLLVDLIMERRPALPMEPFRPGRALHVGGEAR